MDTTNNYASPSTTATTYTYAATTTATTTAPHTLLASDTTHAVSSQVQQVGVGAGVGAGVGVSALNDYAHLPLILDTYVVETRTSTTKIPRKFGRRSSKKNKKCTNQYHPSVILVDVNGARTPWIPLVTPPDQKRLLLKKGK